MGSQRITVLLSKPPNSGEKDESTVFVNKLSFTTSESELLTHFEGCGPIAEVRLIRNRDGRPKGYAYVEFASKDSI